MMGILVNPFSKKILVLLTFLIALSSNSGGYFLNTALGTIVQNVTLSKEGEEMSHSGQDNTLQNITSINASKNIIDLAGERERDLDVILSPCERQAGQLQVVEPNASDITDVLKNICVNSSIHELYGNTSIVFNNTGSANISSFLVKTQGRTLNSSLASNASNANITLLEDNFLLVEPIQPLQQNDTLVLELEWKNYSTPELELNDSYDISGTVIGDISIAPIPDWNGRLNPNEITIRITFEGDGDGFVSMNFGGTCSSHSQTVCIATTSPLNNAIHIVAWPDDDTSRYYKGNPLLTFGGDCRPSRTGNGYTTTDEGFSGADYHDVISSDLTCTVTFERKYADIAPSVDTFDYNTDINQSPSGLVFSLAASSDGNRVYAATLSGVWRSDDRGRNWYQLTTLQSRSGINEFPGALLVPNVYDIAVSPINGDLVLATTWGDTRVHPENGVYRSIDGGETWTLVHKFTCTGIAEDGTNVGQIIFAPDDPNIVAAAGDCAIAISNDAGVSWREVRVPSWHVWHVAIAPAEESIRRIYAAGNNQLWYSEDEGRTWTRDPLQGATLPNGTPVPFGDGPCVHICASSKILAVEPGHPDHVYLAANEGNNGLVYGLPGTPDGTDCVIFGCGGGSLWLADFSSFDTNGRALWTQMKNPTGYCGATGSGRGFVEAKPVSDGYLLFFSDRGIVAVSKDRPSTVDSWHMLSGSDISAKRLNPGNNECLMHVDPQAIAVSSDFSIMLREPTGVTFPYDQNKILDRYIGGAIWIGNDGGIYASYDGGQRWILSSALSTLLLKNLAGLKSQGNLPAFFFGIADNDNFFTLDGGLAGRRSWQDPIIDEGDASPFFSDSKQPSRVISFGTRVHQNQYFTNGDAFILYRSNNPSSYPNAADAGSFITIPCPQDADGNERTDECFARTQYYILGYRPVVQTLLNEPTFPDGDYIMIKKNIDGSKVLLRTFFISAINDRSDWNNPTLAFQQGPALPLSAEVAQASGGHSNTVFYVSDPFTSKSLWKWKMGDPDWTRIVPGNGADLAYRFFVNPYNPNTIYIIDNDGIKRSDDGGNNWSVDTNLNNAVTQDGEFSHLKVFDEGWIINDMIFSRSNPSTAFAVGNSGVFYTTDGRTWTRLLNTSAIPGHPFTAFLDEDTRSLYVAINGRGIIRYDNIPIS